MPQIYVNGTRIDIQNETPKITSVLQIAARLDLEDIEEEVIQRGWDAIMSAFDILINGVKVKRETTTKAGDQITVRKRNLTGM